ncbi:four-domain proteases inhibitor isoform X2 [Cephus cinctus]|uniref:Four-domain proteases inhibitor isoform X2 n=1 Tax=Cephus cinctus TaxID=211228 RepID=A0AAJ7C817_CEPCN|nr:four-domain proteases inhibitor isoform X2 [Cephus cinctus]
MTRIYVILTIFAISMTCLVTALPASGRVHGPQNTQNPPARPRMTTVPTTSSSTTSASQGSNTGGACQDNCPTTPEYNPICGTDGVVYSNPGKLSCARRCGKSVELSHYGPCPSTTTASG